MVLLALAAFAAASGCEADLSAALAEVRAQSPAACESYCQARVDCEWRAAPPLPSDDATLARQDAQVRCENDCGWYMGNGAWLSGAPQDPRYDREYVDQVSARALSSAVTCLWDAGLFACVEAVAPDPASGGFGLAASTASLCSTAASCVESLGVSFAWSATGGDCGPVGGVSVEAPFFQAPGVVP